ncbi:MAG TPA: hypothetical protein VMS76_09650 [Planctomycetota bacterium]|nr:hypothetical protein [Planctomycetota bacterium]
MRSAFLTLAFLAPLASLAHAQRSERPGVATGEWTAPTADQDGLMQGLLRRADGTIVLGISATVSADRGGHAGQFYGHLLQIDDGPQIGPLVSVAGTWKDNGHGLGVFEGDFYIEGILPMMPVIVVGGILGEFGHDLAGAEPELAGSYARSADVAGSSPRSGVILCPAERGVAAKATDAVAKAPADLARRAGGQPEKPAATPPKTSQFFASWNL